MILKHALLDKLKDSMRLNIYEAKVYTALLSRGISSAGELADISGVPRSRCYDVLESLEKKGFVFMKIGKPIKYIAIAPEEVLDTLKKQTTIEKNRLVSLYEEIKTTESFGELEKLYNTGINYVESTDISHSITGRQNINIFLKDMFAKAPGNVTIHTTSDGVKRKLKVLRKSVKKGVTVTIHAPANKIKIKEKNITINEKDIGMRMVHTDNDEMLFFTTPEEIDPTQESAVWIKGKFAIDAINKILE